MSQLSSKLWMLLVCGSLLTASAYSSSPLGTAAHAKARPQRLLRNTPKDDWTAIGPIGPEELDQEAAWEDVIRRNRIARRDLGRRQRAQSNKGGKVERPMESRTETLERIFQRLPLPSRIRPEVPWTTGGYRPSRAYHKEYSVPKNQLGKVLGERIPGHMDPVDLKARDFFGQGVIEIGEALKRAIAEDGAGLRKAFSGGPYEVRELVVKTRAPAFRNHRYGISYRFTLMLRGIYQSQVG
jgi:hypothetical protein